ncbi:lysophospholipid acyltransferase family protein [Natronoglycomyces albus]|uniref:1-acyl-sn-glycerol-3-phosphate acyltransferase n=1 Tax=Natronoglycomyces albus TaxID=2811108 RepID=A0A895XSM8_9ACTN|nr:lysophospholipid acyltransferase family protein [Natronoglycomyces albus]QSB06329.1 1-acyl-sn-glycerol-3-phosphate acyltransferase [Natronoglycomyces albus]
MLYWFLKYILIGPWLRLIWRPKVEGLANIPDSGPAILASNHLSFSDSIFLPLVVKRQITFIAKSDYFTGRGIKGLVSRMFFAGVGTIPVDRTGGKAAHAALETGLRVLKEGRLFGIYPEGTRSPDGRLYRGKTGMARLALESGVGVIPVAMMNTRELQPIGRALPRMGRVHIRIGEPIDFSRYAGLAGDRIVERAVTDQVMYALMELSGQDYFDEYASKIKAMKEVTDASRQEAERKRSAEKMRLRAETAHGVEPAGAVERSTSDSAEETGRDDAAVIKADTAPESGSARTERADTGAPSREDKEARNGPAR